MGKLILLVDDSPAVRTLTRRYLEVHPNLEICGEASDGIEAVEQALHLTPDLIVMDFSMPRRNGLEAARELKQKMPQVPIILFTGHESAVRVSEAMEAGISTIIAKCESRKLLLEILSLLGQPDQVVSARV